MEKCIAKKQPFFLFQYMYFKISLYCNEFIGFIVCFFGEFFLLFFFLALVFLNIKQPFNRHESLVIIK